MTRRLPRVALHDPRLSYELGGGETLTLHLGDLLLSHGYELTVVTTPGRRSPLFRAFCAKHEDSGALRVIERAADGEATDASIGDSSRQALLEADRLAPESLSFNDATRRLYSSLDVDLIVVSFVLDLAGLGGRQPVLLNVFGVPPNAEIAAVERPLLDRVTHYSHASRYAAATFRDLFGLSASQCSGPVVHGSAHEAFFAPMAEMTRAATVCYVGRLVKRKGVHELLEALQWLRAERGLIARLVVAGDGPERKDLLGRAERLRLGDQVTWLGAVGREQVIEVLDNSTVFAYPTLLPEAFGISNIEAMARGTAVVSTNLGGASEYIVPGQNALTCPPGDIEGLGACLERGLLDSGLRRRLTRLGRTTAERFRPSAIDDQWVAVFEKALGARS